MRRVSLKKKAIVRRKMSSKRSRDDGGLYFNRRSTRFIPTGCTLLNCAIGGASGKKGGGWPLNRITNIVGDKSTGKTLLAIEAVPNFFRCYPDGEVFYHEVEAAFDKPYAQSLGMPVDRVIFPGDDEDGIAAIGDTVEDFFTSLDVLCDKRIGKDSPPLLYILDSVDALTDEAEKKRKIDEGTYGTKAKQMSQVFRRLTRKLARARITVILISQIRAKMDAVQFGKKTTRSGGKALDFYASVIIELAEVKKLWRESRGIKRPIGILVSCFVDKNKVGPPFRRVTFPVMFNYGIDDEAASFDWLRKEVKIGIADWRDLGYKGKGAPTVALLNNNIEDPDWVQDLQALTVDIWQEVERDFMPTRRKYQ